MRTPIACAALIALSGLPCIALAQSTDQSSTTGVRAGAAAAPVATSAAVPAATPATTPVAAVADTYQLDPIVVTAQRASQSLSTAVPQTTVFTRDDIANSGATDLAGLLSLAPGAQIGTTGPLGSTASLYLRGASSTESLVLIDGVRVDSVSLGSAQFAQLMLDQIDHVEVVNGNVSSLYGSGAIGGVVQIFTKDGDNHPPQFHFSAGYGSYHTQSQDVGVSGWLTSDGATTFSIDLSRYKSDGFSSINTAQEPNANPNANGYLNESLSASLRHKFSDTWEAGVNFFQSNGYDSFDNAYGAPTDLNTLYTKVQEASVYAKGQVTDWWTTRVSAGLGKDRQQSWLAGNYENGTYDFNGNYWGAYPLGTYVPAAYTDYFDTDNHQYTWQNDFTIAPDNKIQAGYERLDQSLESDQLSVPERHVNSFWLGYDGRLGRNQFQANIRHDQYSDFGGANSFYLGYGFDITNALKATLSYSDAFRAPSFDDLYYPGSGNLSIQPERSHTLEGAVQYASSSLGVARLSLFETNYEDLINYVPDSTGYYYIAQNVGRAKVQGIEASWRGQVAGTDLRASATVQNPVNESADQDLYQRARRFASFSASHKFGDVRAGAEWLVSGPRLDSSGNTLGGYGIVNLTARYNITKSWYVGANVNNLFDKKYETVYGYNTPRISGFLTVGYQQQ